MPFLLCYLVPGTAREIIKTFLPLILSVFCSEGRCVFVSKNEGPSPGQVQWETWASSTNQSLTVILFYFTPVIRRSCHGPIVLKPNGQVRMLKGRSNYLDLSSSKNNIFLMEGYQYD